MPLSSPPRSSLVRRDGQTQLVVAVLVIGFGLVAALNRLTPADHALHISDFYVSLIGKYLAYALLAISLDLVWGYGGILSLGHGAFFALGGYAAGMHLMRLIGPRGQYANPVLPDFMVFLDWKELPWFWLGFDQFWFACLMVVAVPGVLAFGFGWFAFRSRVTGVYLSIITQALTYALMLAFFRNEMGFGGNNGFTDFKEVLGMPLSPGAIVGTNEGDVAVTRLILLAATTVALGGGFVLCRWIAAGRAGQVLMAVRDAEMRTRFLGYPVESYKLFVFTLSAVLAGIAGALYVPQVGIINPSEFSPINSIEIVIWVAVGGRGTLWGPVLGAIAVNALKSVFTTGSLAEVWLFVLGAMFVLTTLFLPHGLAGLLKQLRLPRRRPPVLKEAVG